jgi:hypothetical protein
MRPGLCGFWGRRKGPESNYFWDRENKFYLQNAAF